jgi:pimeloyl-ACP methyl ester carboxylesterase
MALTNSPRIESLLSARLFMDPQVVGNRIFFISNMSGQMSLYAMDRGGSVPEPLIPPDIAMQNPMLIGGYSYCVLPKLGKIVLMLDRHGDENYQPVVVPIDGGYPEPIFSNELADKRVHMDAPDMKRNIVYFPTESRKEQMIYTYQADLRRMKLRLMGKGTWGPWLDTANETHDRAVLIDGYTAADNVLYLWEKGAKERRLLYGKPIEERKEGEIVPLNGISNSQFIEDDRGLIFITYLFDDAGGLGYIDLAKPEKITPVAVKGTVHEGRGMLESLHHLEEDRYSLCYNIDGCSWLYEGTYHTAAKEMRIEATVCGTVGLSSGMLQSHRYDKARKRWALTYSTATSPAQIYTVEGKERKVTRQTNERVLAIPPELLSPGEDASYESFDGTRVSARLYHPPASLGFEGMRPLVYYVHGGPQSQERPDFAWFSMPLIQFLAMNGFAIFVPNVRGSSGYGLNYMKQVDKDWGGKDRLDHVHAMTKVLPKDRRLDVSRAAVVGRSYGGYMTLTLAARHPDLWAAACDMFGPYDLIKFYDRIPETWKPTFALTMGDPVKDRDFFIERSPKTYIENVSCPLLVIQGKNDPRVVEKESMDLVEQLRSKGKDVEFLVFEDEGHDVIKFPNKVRCYNTIKEFFTSRLKP